ncbi:uncharacterized protein LOC128669392 [Plodia interpunctella]|uniref:uncharacterized protein LOC128669392 n=1 Tax=Plodia interpunctella TaxID=58824 RepID=UPI0023684AE0|nr:uncharacterized protein LOC128669392 [Plodia interpunctella]
MVLKSVLHNYTGFLVIIQCCSIAAFGTKNFDCGPYGFVCEGASKLRICEGENLLGPAFLCPPNSRCNEDSSEVCESTHNYMDHSLTKNIRCHKNERIADPNVPGCKGYILCIPNKNRFQGIKFKCTGSTIFNGYTRTCSAPSEYKCPIENVTKPPLDLFVEENRRIDSDPHRNAPQRPRPLECKNYKFSVTDANGPVRAAYFCPPRPIRGETNVRCTIFSSKFCITLERDDSDQFSQTYGVAYRKPRK